MMPPTSVLHLVIMIGIATSTTGLELHDRGKEIFPCIISVILLLASHIRSSLLMMWQLNMPQSFDKIESLSKTATGIGGHELA